MRAPHFLLAALVALATSFSLHAVARHRHHGRQGQFDGHHGPFGHYGDRWDHRHGWGFRPDDDAPTHRDATSLRPDFGSGQPAAPGPATGPLPTPADSATPAR